MNQIYIGIYVFIALCCINGNNAGKTSRPTVIALRKSIPEVQRAAYFAVFELQSQTGKYITMRNIDDAKKEIINRGRKTMYYLTLSLTVIDNGEDQDETCDIVIMDNPNGNPFNSFVSKQCEGTLGQLDPPIMVWTKEPVIVS